MEIGVLHHEPRTQSEIRATAQELHSASSGLHAAPVVEPASTEPSVLATKLIN